MLVALTLIIISISAAILMSFGNQSTLVDSQTYSEAAYIAQSFLDKVRIDSRVHFQSVYPKTLPEIDIYKDNKLEVSNWGPYGFVKKISAGVKDWNIDPRNEYVQLATLVSNYERLLNLNSDDCSQTLTGDWSQIEHYDFQSAEIIPGNNADGIAITDLKVFNQKLYVAVFEPTSTNSSTFYIFDLPENPSQTPIFRGRCDNSSSVTVGLNSVIIAPNGNKLYAYVANAYASASVNCLENHNCAQVQVIDVTDPSNPTAVKNIKIPSATSGNKLPAGNKVYFYRGFLYVGLAKVVDNGTNLRGEFNIIDVGGGGSPASPINPILKGTLFIGAGINDILVQGKYAYIAHPASNNPQRQLTVLDISDPQSPQPISKFYHHGAIGGNGKSLYVKDDNLYFGRTATKLSGTNDAIPEFFMFNNSNPTTDPLLSFGSLPLPQSGDSINGLAVKNNLVFFITNQEFQVWDVSNPSAINLYSSVSLSEFSQGSTTGSGTSLYCSGDYFYIAVQSPQGNNKDIISVITSKTQNEYILSNSGDISVTQGEAGKNTISAAIVSGFPPGVSFSASGLPAGASANFNPASCAPNCSAELEISTSFPATPAGTYPITVTGTGGKTTSFNLIVAQQPFDYALSQPADVVLTRAGASQSTSLAATLISGNSETVDFTVSSLPGGVTVNSIVSCNPTCSRTLTFSASASAEIGSRLITITGSLLGKNTSFMLNVNAPAFSYALNNIANFTIMRGGPAVPLTVTATMTPGAVPQSISLTPPNPSPANISISPTSASCAPSSTAPYQCSVTFNYSSPSGARKGTHSNQYVVGSPGNILSNKFQIKVD